MSAKEVRAARVFFLVTTHCDGRQMGNSLKIDMPKKNRNKIFFICKNVSGFFCLFFVVGFLLLVFFWSYFSLIFVSQLIAPENARKQSISTLFLFSFLFSFFFSLRFFLRFFPVESNLFFCFIAWATAGKHLKQFGVADPVPKQGHYEISRETKEKIRDFLKRPSVSRPAPDRSVYSVDLDGNKSRTGVRFLEKTAWALYEDFCVECFLDVDDPMQPGQRMKKPLLSAAQWYREIPVEYKEPEKETGTSFVLPFLFDSFFLGLFLCSLSAKTLKKRENVHKSVLNFS